MVEVGGWRERGMARSWRGEGGMPMGRREGEMMRGQREGVVGVVEPPYWRPLYSKSRDVLGEPLTHI